MRRRQPSRAFDLSRTPANPTASLSRSQLLLLSATFFATTGLLWILTRNLVAPNGKTLLLLGIRVGTAAVGIGIDASKQKPADSTSGNVLVDMLSGSAGVEIHRLRAVVATLVVAFYFAYEAFQSLTFPDIDNGWLALLTLSGGTYAGLKLNNDLLLERLAM